MFFALLVPGSFHSFFAPHFMLFVFSHLISVCLSFSFAAFVVVLRQTRFSFLFCRPKIVCFVCIVHVAIFSLFVLLLVFIFLGFSKVYMNIFSSFGYCSAALEFTTPQSLVIFFFAIMWVCESFWICSKQYLENFNFDKPSK